MVGDGMGRRSVVVKKGDLTGSERGPGSRWLLVWPLPKQTWPVVRVGADRRYESTDAKPGYLAPSGVRAPIVALNPGNAGRAKGCRKVDG